ncbi:MAG: hypothetical protein GXP31_13120, partial [Kiritimatiellaeota bacterium]|nr:hypothetical protein [Kiritimatiellota bacterium]
VRVVKRGPRYMRAEVAHGAGGAVGVDLFQTADIREWGVLFFIRTGPADYVRRMLWHWKLYTMYRGRIEANRLWNEDGTAANTNEERDVFEALHLTWVAPEGRK